MFDFFIVDINLVYSKQAEQTVEMSSDRIMYLTEVWPRSIW